MLCDVLHTVAKLQGSLQSKELDLATVPVMVASTVVRLQVNLKRSHPLVLGSRITHQIFGDADNKSFISRVDHIASRLKSSGIKLSSLFDL